jgi:hypothetical protein
VRTHSLGFDLNRSLCRPLIPKRLARPSISEAGTRRSVVVSALKEVDPRIADSIDDAVLFREPA